MTCRDLLFLAVVTTSLMPVPAHAEKFMRYDGDPERVTIFHMVRCRASVQSSSNAPLQHATIYSRHTNKPVAQGCWRFEDKILAVLLQIEGDTRTFRFFASQLEHGERF